MTSVNTSLWVFGPYCSSQFEPITDESIPNILIVACFRKTHRAFWLHPSIVTHASTHWDGNGERSSSHGFIPAFTNIKHHGSYVHLLHRLSWTAHKVWAQTDWVPGSSWEVTAHLWKHLDTVLSITLTVTNAQTEPVTWPFTRPVYSWFQPMFVLRWWCMVVHTCHMFSAATGGRTDASRDKRGLPAE